MQNKLSTILFAQLKQFNESLPVRSPKLLENYLRPNQLLSIFAKDLEKTNCDIQVLSCEPCSDFMRIQLVNPNTSSLITQDMELMEVIFEGETYWVFGGMQWKYVAESQHVSYEPDSPLDIGDINELSIYTVVRECEVMQKMQELIQSCKEPKKLLALLSLFK